MSRYRKQSELNIWQVVLLVAVVLGVSFGLAAFVVSMATAR